MKVLVIIAFLAVALTSCGGSSEENSRLEALHGVPQTYPALAVSAQTDKFVFYKVDPRQGGPLYEAGKPVVSHEIIVKPNFNAPVVELYDGNQKLGKLSRNPSASYSFFSNDPWDCKLVEESLVKKTDTAAHYPSEALDDENKCYLETNIKGQQELAISVVGLKGGEGLKDWVNNSRPDVPLGGKAVFGTPLKPGQINMQLDFAKTKAAFEAIAGEFKQNSDRAMNERNTCLKNERATVWHDIQSHYYCQIPLYPLRDAFATRLVALRTSLVTLVKTKAKLESGTVTDPAEKTRLQGLIGNIAKTLAQDVGRTSCGDPRDPDFLKKINIFCIAFAEKLATHPFFSKPENKKSFEHLMYIRSDMADFNIESQNEVINAFYQDLGQERPRRLMDTFPKWLPDQPRYNMIRSIQKMTLSGERQ